MVNQFYKVIIEPQEEGGFTAYIPKLPGCISEGESYNETLENIQEALKLYIETMLERNLKVVEDDIHFAEVCVAI